MPANPDGAHQVNRHMVDREVARWVVDLDDKRAYRGFPPRSGDPLRGTPRRR